MKNKIWLLVIGLVTGLLVEFFKLNVMELSPGITFGIAVAFYLILVQRKNFFISLTFIPISMGAFFASLLIAMTIGGLEYNMGFFLAGIAGSIILSFAIGIYYKISFRNFWLPILAGGIVGFMYPYITTGFFALWQSTVAFLIGNVIDQNNKRNIIAQQK